MMLHKMCMLWVCLFLSGAVVAQDGNDVEPALVAHLTLDGDLLDALGSSDVNEVNLVGDANFVSGLYDQALILDGDGDYANLGATFANNVCSGLTSFSASAWVLGQNNSPTGVYPRIFNIGNADNSEYIALLPYSDGTPEAPKHQGACGGPRFELKSKNGGNQTTNACIATMDPNEWNNIVATLDADANTATIYVNGVFAVDNNAVSNNPSMVSVYDEALLGTAPITKNKNYFMGQIDDVRLYNYTLTSDQAAAIYGGLVASYDFNGDVADATGFGNDGTLYGDPVFDVGAEGHAIVLDGIDDFITIPQLANNNAWTVAFWLNTTDGSAETDWWNGKGLINCERGGHKGDWGTSLARGGKVLASYGDQVLAAGSPLLESSMDVNDGNWHHVAVTFTGDNGTFNLYIDGALDQTAATEQLKIAGDIEFILIGAIGNTKEGYINWASVVKQGGPNLPWEGRYLNGMMDEIKIFDWAITEDMVKDLATLP